MAITKVKKQEIVSNLIDIFNNSQSIAFTKNNWLSVEEISKLRKDLREVWASYTLAKKTLIKIAFKEVYWKELTDDLLPEQISVLASREDAVAWLSKLSSYMKGINKKVERISWAGWYFEWEIKNAEEIKLLASIPSRETLLGRLIWSMQSPISSLARFFDAASKKLSEESKENLGQLDSPTKEETLVNSEENISTNKEEKEEENSQKAN